MAQKGHVKSLNKRKEAIGRPERWRAYKQYFLIVCEDEKTEPAYFNQFKSLFPEHTIYLRNIGTGFDQLGIIEHAIKERQKLEEESNKSVDFTWTVFDKDDADKSQGKIKRFYQAYKLASVNDINIALSNEVFELWLLLHFIEINASSPISRKLIYLHLEECIKAKDADFKYVHGQDKIIEKVLNYGNEKLASKRAIKLLEKQKSIEPLKRNPSTEIHILVQILREWIAYYNHSNI